MALRNMVTVYWPDNDPTIVHKFGLRTWIWISTCTVFISIEITGIHVAEAEILNSGQASGGGGEWLPGLHKSAVGERYL